MKAPSSWSAAILLSALLAVACSSPTEPLREQRTATIVSSSDGLLVSVPASVFAKVPFTVTVRTLAGGCSEEGPTKVTREAGVVLVEPFDIHWEPRPGEACRDVLAFYTHSVEVMIEVAGRTSLQVRGFNSVTARVETYSFHLEMN